MAQMAGDHLLETGACNLLGAEAYLRTAVVPVLEAACRRAGSLDQAGTVLEVHRVHRAVGKDLGGRRRVASKVDRHGTIQEAEGHLAFVQGAEDHLAYVQEEGHHPAYVLEAVRRHAHVPEDHRRAGAQVGEPETVLRDDQGDPEAVRHGIVLEAVGHRGTDPAEEVRRGTGLSPDRDRDQEDLEDHLAAVEVVHGIDWERWNALTLGFGDRGHATRLVLAQTVQDHVLVHP